MHLPGGPSIGETFALASDFQIRKCVEAGVRPLDFPPRTIRFPRQNMIFAAWEMVKQTSVGCVGNLAEG